MNNNYFESLALNIGAKIRIVNSGGEGFIGYYRGDYNPDKCTFLFYSFSTGMEEIINISNLQYLEMDNT